MAEQLPGAAARLVNGILHENPTYRQMLGMCPTLAVTGNLASALTMAGATTFVLISANVLTSLIRGVIRPHLRILVFTIVIAGFVTVVDRVLHAFLPAMYDALGAFIALIIVNCIIISRCEICAAKQGPGVAAADGLGQGLGFLLGLSSIAAVRELLGSGKLLGFTLLPDAIWPDWTIMALAPGAFFTLGLLLAAVNAWQARRKRLAAAAARTEG